MHRREFLKLGMLAAAAQLAVPRPRYSFAQTLSRTGPTRKVIVIGAGLAGLVAAYELTNAGHDVIVLEAQLRPGGRVLTLRAPFSDGLYAEAGAARIPDTHTLTLQYARNFGLKLVPFYPNQLDKVYVLGGERIKIRPGVELDLSQVPFQLTTEERGLNVSGLVTKYLSRALHDIGDPSAPDWPPPAAKAYDNVTMAEFLRDRGASHGAIELLEYPFASAESDPVSLLWNLRETWHTLQEKNRFKIDGGNDLLPRAFAARLNDNIHYGAAVVRIEQSPVKVRVIAVQSGIHRVFEGDHLICTVPFPALRRVDVEPPFSDEKRKAIMGLAYDTITRVVLQCRTRYWEKDGCNGFGVSDLPQEIWHPSFDQKGKRGLLVSYMFFSVGRRAGEMSEDKRIDFVCEQLERVHPGLRENLEGAVCKVWLADPWAGGAAAIPSPGQMTTLCKGIDRPEGRVHFAGEHTSRWTGWMQGALESGLRAAQEVNEAT